MTTLARFQSMANPLPLLHRFHKIPSNPLPPLLLPQRLHSPSFLPALARSFRGMASGAVPPVVVAADDKYGKKQVISVTPQLYDYILSNVREPPILRELREETSRMPGSQMQVSPEQAQLLAMIVQILGAKRCIEVGIYTGYSSLAIALVLPESGSLVACEKDIKSLEIAKKYYERAGVSHKVVVKHGQADKTLESMIKNNEACSYDFAFVDADKSKYDNYFELLLQLVRGGGLIVFDNVLWHGRVVDPDVNDKKTISLRNLNKKILQDERVSISMVPIGDGMTICRKSGDSLMPAAVKRYMSSLISDKICDWKKKDAVSYWFGTESSALSMGAKTL